MPWKTLFGASKPEQTGKDSDAKIPPTDPDVREDPQDPDGMQIDEPSMAAGLSAGSGSGANSNLRRNENTSSVRVQADVSPTRGKRRSDDAMPGPKRQKSPVNTLEHDDLDGELERSDDLDDGESIAAPHDPETSSTYDAGDLDGDTSHGDASLVKDLETRAITVSQLIQEVKGIYAGLVMVEKKCIEIVTQQAQSPTKLSKEQWQALIALHRTLLNEHHDFFSASHHPVTKNHELRELAARYAMPARMWRHGIHAFLELLRHRLPESLEHMLSFVYLAYSMMALLMETVPDFLETWIECLGDLARYRMAIEETDLRDREIWSNTARTWYHSAADLSPNTGRIQHHLAVLARPNIVQQLFLYSKALVAAIPFKNAGESILLLFNPLLEQKNANSSRYQPAEYSLVCGAAVLFKRRSVVEFESYAKQFIDSLENHMARSGSRFKQQGPEIAGSLLAMLTDFGNDANPFWKLMVQYQEELRKEYCIIQDLDPAKLPKDLVVDNQNQLNAVRARLWRDIPTGVRIGPRRLSSEALFNASEDISSYVAPMLRQAIALVALQIGNKNAVPFMHVILAHLLALTYIPEASIHVEACVPWEEIVQFLNTVGRPGVSYENIESPAFPKSFGGSKRQLPEDFAMRGLMPLTYYYQPGFFAKDELVDEDERQLEQPSHQAPRVERCLWAAIQLSETSDRWLRYDRQTKMFSVTEFARNLSQL